MSLAHGRLLSIQPGEATIAFTREADFHRSAVTGQSGKQAIERILSDHFGTPMRLTIADSTVAADRAPPSLAEEEAKAREDRTRSTELKVRGHPSVKAALEILGGQIEHIEVLDPKPDSTSMVDSPDEAS